MAKPSFLQTRVKPLCKDGENPRQVLVDAYDEHKSLAVLASIFNANPSTISKNLKECHLMGYRPSTGSAL